MHLYRPNLNQSHIRVCLLPLFMWSDGPAVFLFVPWLCSFFLVFLVFLVFSLFQGLNGLRWTYSWVICDYFRLDISVCALHMLGCTEYLVVGWNETLLFLTLSFPSLTLACRIWVAGSFATSNIPKVTRWSFRICKQCYKPWKGMHHMYRIDDF